MSLPARTNLNPVEMDEPTHDTPLFAHECAGMADEAQKQERAEPQGRGTDGRGYDPDLEDVDFDDPTLEKFPSNKSEIMDAVRKLEGGLNEDRATFDVGPPSPVMGSSRRSSFDYELAGDPQATPTNASASRKSKHLEVPRSPHDSSVGSNRSSALSLHSIAEGEEATITEDD